MASSKTVTVGYEGVVMYHLNYNSHELQDLRRSVGHTFRTEVKFSPEDLHHLWVQDPVKKSWLKVPSCHPEYTKGLSITQHQAIRAVSNLLRRDAAAT